MSSIDWSIIVVYILGMIGLSIYLSRGQADDQDYYVGGRNIPWWAVGLSIVATQSSAISFVSIPAFVALSEGGGLSWLQYELAVPLAMIFILAFLVPYFRSLKLVSVFEFLESRYDRRTSEFLSLVFLFSRGFGTGVGVYATSLVLSAILDIPLTYTIIMIGVIAIVYDTIGGITAVVYSDVIQLILMVVGALLCIGYAFNHVGGWGPMFAAIEPQRLVAFNGGHGLGDESAVPFWAYLIGGFFLYSSYYGTDQSQVQRTLCTSSVAETKLSLIVNGLARLPLTLLYLTMGVAIGAVYVHSESLRSAVPADHLDYLVPKFIIHFLPVGAKGLILAAILAAAMSSLDSSINSLSAVTMRDHLEKRFDWNAEQQLRMGKITTVIWGMIVTGSAFAAGNISSTVIEAINKVGSAFYGPVLACFVIGTVTKRINGPIIIPSVLVGVAVNFTFWIQQVPIHWMWWNAIGFFVTVWMSVLLFAVFRSAILEKKEAPHHMPLKIEGSDIKSYLILLLYFFGILSMVLGSYVAFAN